MNARLNYAHPTDPIQWATLALDYRLEALSEAERDGATAGEIVRLCDEVIARRLEVQMLLIEAGWAAAAHVIAQMNRDRRLLDQPSVPDE